MEYKFGRRKPSNKPALMLGQVLSTIVPPHPICVDYIAFFKDWDPLANDLYGNCVAVAWANMTRSITGLLGLNDAEIYPNLEQVLELYKTQNPGFPVEDNGMDMQTMLEHILHNGDPVGRRPVAFAKVHPYDEEEVKAALAIFGVLLLGIQVDKEVVTCFDAGLPIDHSADHPMLGGHAVIGGGYLGKDEEDIRFVTWGKLTGMTDRFLHSGMLEEAWVVVWPEHLGTKQFREGIDMDKLADYYRALTGRPLFEPSWSPSGPSTSPSDAPGCLPAAVRKLLR